MLNVELYYGYYLGDAQMWDTIDVEIPCDTKEEDIEKEALARFPVHGDVQIAFIGVHHIGEVEEDEGEDWT